LINEANPAFTFLQFSTLVVIRGHPRRNIQKQGTLDTG